MVETPAPEQPEVSHPDLSGGRRVSGRPDHSPAADQVGGQAVDRLQHGQTAQGGLDAPRRGGPGRVLVVGAISALRLFPCRTRCGKWGTVLVLQVRRVVVVQGEAFGEVRRQFPLRVEVGQPGGAGLLPGRRMLVVGDVEQVHGPAGQEPAVLPALGHAPHHGLHPAATAQGSQHSSNPVLGQAEDGGQVGHAGQGHPGDDFQEPSLFVGQLFPLRHPCISAPRDGCLPLVHGFTRLSQGLRRKYS